MESSARALIEQTFDTLTPIAQAIKPAVPPTPLTSDSQNSNAGPPPISPAIGMQQVAVRRPSQIEFGLGILNHMYEDTVPAPYRAPVMIGLGMLLMLMLISLRNALFNR